MRENTATNSTDQQNEIKKPAVEELVNARKETLQEAKAFSGEPSFEWLTDHSRKFLASGYLPEGVSAEERIREIAERAEEILQIPGYADKFYRYMGEGDFSLDSPDWSNYGKRRGLPISCFVSKIYDDMVNML